MNTFYRFKFYINAKHWVNFDGKASNIHPHTWEIVVRFGPNSSDAVNFTQFEKELESCFSIYQGKLLNELSCFSGISPTMENIGRLLFKDIGKIMSEKHFHLKSFEISENPTRSFIIENE